MITGTCMAYTSMIKKSSYHNTFITVNKLLFNILHRFGYMLQQIHEK
jgi:hypothetical protein